MADKKKTSQKHVQDARQSVKNESASLPDLSSSTTVHSPSDADASGTNTADLPPDVAAKLASPELFAGRYKIDALLGEGGMSRVYKGVDASLNRVVAIKKMLPQYLHRDISRQRFQREAISIAALDHPNIVSVYHCDVTVQGTPFIVMECLNGKSLSSVIETDGPLPFSRALPIFIQIADALAHAHGRGVVHRDLKPSNVLLVTEFGAVDRVGIVDFGIARLLPKEGDDAANLTQTGEIFGSPSSMSPEQCRGHRVDDRADIYSFACLMYETLTGDPPFDGDSVFEVIAAHLHETARGINEIAPGSVPDDFEKLALQMLAKNADDRPKTVDVVLQQLRAMQRNLRKTAFASTPVLSQRDPDLVRQKKRQGSQSGEELLESEEAPDWLALELIWEIPSLSQVPLNTQKKAALAELESIVQLNPTIPSQLVDKNFPAIEMIAPLGLQVERIDVFQKEFDAISRAFAIEEVNSKNVRSCRLLADALMCVQLYHNAEPLYRKMVELLPDGPDPQLKIYKDMIWLSLADCVYLQRSRFNDATTLYNAFLFLFLLLDQPLNGLYALRLSRQSDCHLFDESYKLAEQSFFKVIQLWHSLGNETNRAIAVVKLAYAQSKRGAGQPDAQELKAALDVIGKSAGENSRNYEIARQLFDGM